LKTHLYLTPKLRKRRDTSLHHAHLHRLLLLNVRTSLLRCAWPYQEHRLYWHSNTDYSLIYMPTRDIPLGLQNTRLAVLSLYIYPSNGPNRIGFYPTAEAQLASGRSSSLLLIREDGKYATCIYQVNKILL
jgi:hypothetical protein